MLQECLQQTQEKQAGETLVDLQKRKKGAEDALAVADKLYQQATEVLPLPLIACSVQLSDHLMLCSLCIRQGMLASSPQHC